MQILFFNLNFVVRPWLNSCFTQWNTQGLIFCVHFLFCQEIPEFKCQNFYLPKSSPLIHLSALKGLLNVSF